MARLGDMTMRVEVVVREVSLARPVAALTCLAASVFASFDLSFFAATAAVVAFLLLSADPVSHAAVLVREHFRRPQAPPMPSPAVVECTEAGEAAGQEPAAAGEVRHG